MELSGTDKNERFLRLRRFMFYVGLRSFWGMAIFFAAIAILTLSNIGYLTMTVSAAVATLICLRVVTRFLSDSNVYKNDYMSIKSSLVLLVHFILGILILYGMYTEHQQLWASLLYIQFIVFPIVVTCLIADAIHGDNSVKRLQIPEQKKGNFLVDEKFFHVRRSAYLMIFIAAFLVPIWIGIGRGFWGVGGWGEIGTVLMFAPVLIVFHIFCIFHVLSNVDSNLSRLLSLRSTIILGVYLLAVAIFEVSMVDGGDVDYFSVLSKMTGGIINNSLSKTISFFSFCTIIGAGMLLLTFIIADKDKRKIGQKAPKGSDLPPEMVKKIEGLDRGVGIASDINSKTNR